LLPDVVADISFAYATFTPPMPAMSFAAILLHATRARAMRLPRHTQRVSARDAAHAF